MFDIFLPLAGVSIWWPGLMILGFAVGTLTGLFGVGGGFLLTPALRIIFDIPYPIAVGSDLTQIFFTALFSAGKHWQNKNVDLKLGTLMAVGALVGTEVGVRVLRLISVGGVVSVGGKGMPALDFVLNTLFILLMAAMSLFILRESSRARTGEYGHGLVQVNGRFPVPPFIAIAGSGAERISLWIPLLLSVAVGVLTGLLGIGGGFICFPLLIYVIGLPTMLAVGTSAFQVLFASGYGALRHAGQDHVELLLVAFLLAGSLLGAQAGVRMCTAIGGRNIRKYFAFVLLVAIALIVYDFYRKMFN